MVSLSLKGLKVLSGQVFYAPCHCGLDLRHTDRIINRVHLSAMANNKLINGHDSSDTRQTGGGMDGR